MTSKLHQLFIWHFHHGKNMVTFKGNLILKSDFFTLLGVTCADRINMKKISEVAYLWMTECTNVNFN